MYGNIGTEKVTICVLMLGLGAGLFFCLAQRKSCNTLRLPGNQHINSSSYFFIIYASVNFAYPSCKMHF